MIFDFKPGSLVRLRNRPWIVMPSEDSDVFLVKPLGGTDDEITGIYKPLANQSDVPVSYNFVKPSGADLGDFSSAKLLYNASRLSFRNAAGPFRSLGKLSFRPRSYQMVPLIMALRQKLTRLLIADDVGIGKTIEALLIARELYERKEIKSFAVLCLPHLCDQWQDELKSKFGIQAVIIRSGTVSALDRQLRAHENIFRAFPFQIISIDYIKAGNKRQVFIDHCPEFIIVDEAHSCAKPAGANQAQQLRYHLLHDLASKVDQHLVLLTATPHSGKQVEFQSLLGLLKPEFERHSIVDSNPAMKKELASCFIQRRRSDVLQWMDERTVFPQRLSVDKDYQIGQAYGEVFNDILSYARELVLSNAADSRKQRYSYWDALSLLRGVMSSPAAGISMLEKKARKRQLSEALDEFIDYPEGSENVLDTDFSQDDNLPLQLNSIFEVSDPESRKLMRYAKRLHELSTLEGDSKVREAVAQVKQLLQNGLNPIIFCRYIQTANYLGKICKEYFKGKNYKGLQIEIVTSELNDELRREKIAEMNVATNRLLIATDCLSEGINLQDGFNCLLHYDLPWNPNRLEQREGRIDRFGQRASMVEVILLYGSNNPIDGVVLDVLLRKAKEIRKETGISIPFPENSASVMEAVTNAILLKPQVKIKQLSHQLSIFEADEITAEKNKVAKAFEEAEKREMLSRSIFAQNSIAASEIEQDLKDVDEAIGDVKAVESFVVEALRFMGVQLDVANDGYNLHTTNLPIRLRLLLPDKILIKISFLSPTPFGYLYIGRNHPLTEAIAQVIIHDALNGSQTNRASRTAVIITSAVDERTVLFQFRVRNVILEQPSAKQIVAEEMWLWGYKGSIEAGKYLDKDDALVLLMNAKATQNMALAEQLYWLEEEVEWMSNEEAFRARTDGVALQRANKLVESHAKFRKLVSGSKYKVVEPVLPMDVLGVYVLLPEIGK